MDAKLRHSDEVRNDNAILSIDRIHLSFGALQALFEASLDVTESGIFAIIGPNGAGKTCLLNCISGFYRPQLGSIYFSGTKINSLPVHERTRLGIARTFQNIELFNGLTTLENLLAARQLHFKCGILKASLYFGPARKEEVVHREIADNL